MDPLLLARLAERPPQRILVVQTAFLGDTVFSSALVAGLRTRFAGVPIDLCVAPRGHDVARAIPGVAEVVVYDKSGADSGAPGLRRIARQLSRLKHGLAVLPHRSLRTALLARTANIPERLGFRSAASRLLCTSMVADPGGPFLAREAALLEALGALPGPMRLAPREEDRRAAAATLARLGVDAAEGKKPQAALAIGSEWATKIWPVEQFAALAARLSERGFVPLLVGGPRDTAFAALLQQRSGVPCLDTTGNPVGEALGLLERCVVCIGGDTGLVHAARALGVPTVPIFGPTDPRLHAFGATDLPQWLQLECAPCGPHGHRVCPLGHHRCLRDLGPERVLEAAVRLTRGAAAVRVAPELS